jgi:peptide/nickel transport system permease protein
MVGIYVIRRIGQAVFVLWAAYTITFLLLYVLPSDAVDLLFDPTRISTELESEKERLRTYYGLDQPPWAQYITQLTHLLGGDLGYSIQTGKPVGATIAEVLPQTIVLSVAALGLAIALAFVLAITAVSTSRPWLSNLLKSIPPAFVSVPVFIVGLVLMQVFSFQLHWFPSIGDQGLPTLVLPAITLAIPIAGPLAYLLIRSSTIELSKPYVTTALAKGYRPLQVIWRDVLRNAMLPALTLAGLTFGNLLAGAIIVETVFSRTGIGRLSETAVRTQDIPVVQGVVLFGAVVFVAVNLTVDLVYPLLDPKLRAEIGAGTATSVPRATKAKAAL